MKYFYLFAMVAFFSFSYVDGIAQGKYLFILAGQSNMARLDPEETFIPAVREEFGKDHIVVVKKAMGGQPIRRWYKKWKSASGDQPNSSGKLYDRLMKKVYRSIEGIKIKSITFIWMQGERDARKGHGEVYAASLRGLIEQLKNDLNRKEIKFVIGRLSDFDMDNNRYPHWTLIRKAQMEVAEADPLGAWVKTDDLNDRKNRKGKKTRNGLHYSKEGYRSLGKRFAEKAIELIKKEKAKNK